MTEKSTYKELQERVLESEKSESKLRTAHEELDTILSMSLDMICIADIHTATFIKVNRAFMETLGFSENALLGTPFLEFIHPDDIDSTRRIVEQELSKGKKVLNFENRYRCNDGTYKWLSWVSHPDPEKGVTYAVARDITDLKEAEQALRESEEKFRITFNGSPDAVNINRLKDGLYVDINQGFTDLTGFTREDVIGKTSKEIQVWNDLADRQRLVSILEESGFCENLEARFRRKDGSVTTALMSARVIFLEGEPHIISITRDISDRIRAEEALRESEKKYRIILESMEEGYHEVDLNGRFTFFNTSFQKILGYSHEELMGMSYRRYAADETNRTRVAEAYKRVFTTGEPLHDFAWDIVRKDGIKRTVEVSASLIRDKQNHAVGFRGLVRDITERKRVEEERENLQSQLNQAQKMETVGRLAGGVAHDFNNMLGIIIANAELAGMQLEPDEIVHKNIQEILKASQRAADTVRHLLAFARKQITSPKVLDVNDTISGDLRMLGRLIGEDIHLRFVPGKDVWKVRMDPSQVQQILNNLVVNSRDAMPGGGTITIMCKNTVLDESYCRMHNGVEPGDYVLIAVSDTGEGMTPEVMENLFDPFFTTKEVGKGTGLGLAMVYGAMKQNNGYVQVYSEPDKGTTVELYLPRVIERPASKEEAGKRAAPGGKETVLVAEDESALLDTCRYVLERQGYTVLAASTPKAALDLAAQHPGEIDLLLTDVVMPEMNGKELAKQLRAVRPALKLLFMSGYTSDVMARHGVLDQGMNFIEKPFAFTELAEKVRQVLDAVE